MEKLIHAIGLPEEAEQSAVQYDLPASDYMVWKELFDSDPERFLQTWREETDWRERALPLYLRLALDAYPAYRKKEIPKSVYIDTFRDIAIWCLDCHQKTGIWGIMDIWWLMQSVKLRIFRLGRLQFEKMVLPEKLSENLTEGMDVLQVHIPAGEPLLPEACDASFAAAKQFYNLEHGCFVCDSWLMEPKLSMLLEDNSHIMQFQRRFQIARVHAPFPQAEQRIFGQILEDKNSYPEHTSLQKKAKQYLLAGGQLEIGIGYILF
ncbi:MAG: acyltransferase domain-containing protein [Eubacteriales bacterium]|nr:acyltransferase domain-containing protein [Eubacteriales bacterium]